MDGMASSSADVEVKSLISLTIAGESPEVQAIHSVIVETASVDEAHIVNVERGLKYFSGRAHQQPSDLDNHLHSRLQREAML